jgi:hypothetical protein
MLPITIMEKTKMVTFYKRVKSNGAIRNQASLDFLDDYDTTEIFDERWLSRNRKGNVMPGMARDGDAGMNHALGRENTKKTNSWKKILRFKNHG